MGYRCSYVLCWSFSFFFNDTATTEIYTLSLHDALPIRAALRQRLESPRRRGGLLEAQLQHFYRARDFRPGWTTRLGARREAFELAVTLDRALHGGFERDVAKARRLDSLVLGLRPSLFGPAPDPGRLAELEELLT